MSSKRPVLQMRVGDSGPSVTFIFYRTNAAGTRSAVNISGATVQVTGRQEYNTASDFQRDCTITSATAGKARFDWLVTDLTVATNYGLEIEITHASGVIETAPISPLVEVTAQFPDP